MKFCFMKDSNISNRKDTLLRNAQEQVLDNLQNIHFQNRFVVVTEAACIFF